MFQVRISIITVNRLTKVAKIRRIGTARFMPFRNWTRFIASEIIMVQELWLKISDWNAGIDEMPWLNIVR